MAADNAGTFRMTVCSLTVDPFTGLPMVLLADEGQRRSVAISVGLGEASAIATELERIEVERPMTHHLMRGLLSKAGVQVEAVEVYDLIGTTFYARILLRLPCGERVVQEGRPSDALALALCSGAEIRVTAALLEKANRCAPRLSLDLAGCSMLLADDADLADASDELFGKWKM